MSHHTRRFRFGHNSTTERLIAFLSISNSTVLRGSPSFYPCCFRMALSVLVSVSVLLPFVDNKYFRSKIFETMQERNVK